MGVSKESLDLVEERKSELKRLLPEVFTEGRPDFDKFKEALGDVADKDGERYSFSWAGKTQSVRTRDRRSKATLVPSRKESVDFDGTGNVFIEGENLEVLKILQKSYQGKVKMIYIDPPYNTGKDFVYPDDFKDPLANYLRLTGQVNEKGVKTTTNVETSGRYHSNWLSMMYPRLFLARNLLRDDGVIFVSIDDNEVHNLRLIMNEIFGEENRIAMLCWKGRGGRQDSTHLAEVHEYILCYAKNKEEFSTGGMVKEDEKYPKFDKEKNLHYKTQLARKWGSNSRRQDRPNLFYSVKSPEGTEIYPKLPNGEDGRWRWSKLRMGQEITEKNVEFVKEGKEWIVYEKIYEATNGETKTKKFTTWLDAVGSSSTGTKEMQSLFTDKSSFDYPKPTTLIKRLMSIADVYSGDIILDFFAGSGTTAHAVLELNQEDEGNRKFILVQLPEKTDEKSEAFKQGYKTIAEITKERIRRAIKKIDKEEKGKLIKKNGDLGFKVFKLSKSNCFVWDEDLPKEQETLVKHVEASAKGASAADKEALLFELMLREGFGLDSKIEGLKQGKNNFYKVADGGHVLWLCFDENVDAEAVKKLHLEKDDKLIVLDSALTDTQKVNLSRKTRIETV